jgi:type II secretory pathway pseudopilin PulG
VELLAVVGIIAMLSVAAVPVMRGLGGSQSSRATAQILVSALEQARTAAILSGTNVYLAIPNNSFLVTNLRYTSYVLLRPKVTNNGGPNDDFLTNQSAPWLVLSKWERLPGDLGFSPRRTDSLPLIQVSNLTVVGSNYSGSLPAVGFNPGGSLADPSGTNGLLFASTNPANFETTNAKVADRIAIAQFSGRIRYAGLTNNAPFK